MIKKITKEIGIFILLLVAIALILAIIFYDYIPNNKTIPIKIQAYNIPEDIEKELEESIPDEQTVVKTLYIDDTDLNLYEATKDYDKGKANPFAYYPTEEEQNQTDSANGNNNSTNNNNNTNNDNTTNNNSQNTQGNNTNQNEVYINTPGKNY